MSWSDDITLRWHEVDEDTLGVEWTNASGPRFTGKPMVKFPRAWAADVLAVVQPQSPEDWDRCGTLWHETCACMPVTHDDWSPDQPECTHLEWVTIGNEARSPVLRWQGGAAPFENKAVICDADLLTLLTHVVAIADSA